MICLVKIDRFPGYLIPPKRLITPKVSSFFGMWKKPLSEKMVSCLESVYFPETFNYSEVKLIFFLTLERNPPRDFDFWEYDQLSFTSLILENISIRKTISW